MSRASDLFKQGREAERAGDFGAAEAAYRESLEEDPRHLGALRGLAALLERRGAENEASKISDRVLSGEAEALCAAALALLASGEERKAGAMVERALQLTPGAAAPLRVAALLAGRAGDRTAAEELYGRLARSFPDEGDVAWALAVLRGMALPLCDDGYAGFLVPPHALLEGFLPPERRESALAFALAKLEEMSRASVFRGEAVEDEKARASRVMFRPAELAEWFLPRVAAALPRILPRIGMASFVPGRIELQLTHHGDGDFYRVHSDRGEHDSPADERGRAGELVGGRLVTFVYYFSRRPRRFEGGDLFLYRSLGRGRGYDPSAAFAIAPSDNSIVFFPSAVFHEVRPVRLESADPGDGRFTLNGWVHPAPDG